MIDLIRLRSELRQCADPGCVIYSRRNQCFEHERRAATITGREESAIAHRERRVTAPPTRFVSFPIEPTLFAAEMSTKVDKPDRGPRTTISAAQIRRMIESATRAKPQTGLIPAQLGELAFHEAGHALACERCGGTVGDIELSVQHRSLSGRTSGKGLDDVGDLGVAVSGAVAESLIFRRAVSRGSDDDLEAAARSASAIFGAESGSKMERIVALMVSQLWTDRRLLFGLANELSRRGRLSGDEVRTFIQRFERRKAA